MPLPEVSFVPMLRSGGIENHLSLGGTNIPTALDFKPMSLVK
jgi:hypothetical protein